MRISRLVLLLSLAFFVAVPSSDGADSISSSFLLRSCKSALDADAEKDSKGLDTFCLGYVGGLADMYGVVRAVVPEEHRQELMCIPESVDVEEMIGIIVKYLEDHPALQGEPARVTAAVALSKVFPCA